MTDSFHRDRFTWLVYLLLAFYGYFLNVLGPITPFIKNELALSYTVASLHFTAFAVGILLIGLVGNAALRRMGQLRSLWVGAFGMSLGAAALLAGRSAVVTIAASFWMGLVGSLILAGVPSALSDRHGDLRAVALSEANVIASLVSIAAPLLVGWAAGLPGSWRWALGIAALTPFVARLWFGRVAVPHGEEAPPGGEEPSHASDPLPGLAQPPAAAEPPPARAAPPAVAPGRRHLPRSYWVFWTAVFLAVSLEFCMISWSAGYFAATLHMRVAAAASTIGLFLAGMVLGRLAGSRLVLRFAPQRVVLASIATAALGFGLFWSALDTPLALAGLFLTGLGIASLYPLLLSLAIGVAGDTVRASARATLASGAAVLALPLVLGRLADAVGIRPAYGVVAVLLLAIVAIVLVSGRPAMR